MGRLLIIHGTGGSPQGNWFPWLGQSAKRSGYEVLAPRFPTPNGQSLQSWSEILKKDAGSLKSGDVLVAHSIGGAFALRALEQSKAQTEAAFIISGFVHQLGLPDFDPLTKTFVSDPFDWKAIRKNSKRFFVYHGTDDPYVPLRLGQEIAENLGVPLTVIDRGGHLNAESGYTRFDQLLADLDSFTPRK